MIIDQADMNITIEELLSELEPASALQTTCTVINCPDSKSGHDRIVFALQGADAQLIALRIAKLIDNLPCQEAESAAPAD